jgi:hypothetical protein
MWVNFGKEVFHIKPVSNCGLRKNQCSENYTAEQEHTGKFVLIIYILRWIFRKWEGVVGTGRSWLRIGRGGGHL